MSSRTQRDGGPVKAHPKGARFVHHARHERRQRSPRAIDEKRPAFLRVMFRRNTISIRARSLTRCRGPRVDIIRVRHDQNTRPALITFTTQSTPHHTALASRPALLNIWPPPTKVPTPKLRNKGPSILPPRMNSPTPGVHHGLHRRAILTQTLSIPQRRSQGETSHHRARDP